MIGIAGLFAIAAASSAAAPVPAAIPCARTGGPVSFEVSSAAGDIVFAVTYPKSVGSYLGGFVQGAKKTSADVKFYLDLDGNPSTGLAGDPTFAPGTGGSEFSIETQEVETSVGKDAAGAWVQKPVLMVTVRKQDDFFSLPDGVSPKWEMESGGRWQPIDWMSVPDSRRMRMALPWSAIGGKPDSTVRVTEVVPICHDAFPFPGSRETTVVLR